MLKVTQLVNSIVRASTGSFLMSPMFFQHLTTEAECQAHTDNSSLSRDGSMCTEASHPKASLEKKSMMTAK